MCWLISHLLWVSSIPVEHFHLQSLCFCQQPNAVFLSYPRFVLTLTGNSRFAFSQGETKHHASRRQTEVFLFKLDVLRIGNKTFPLILRFLATFFSLGTARWNFATLALVGDWSSPWYVCVCMSWNSDRCRIRRDPATKVIGSGHFQSDILPYFHLCVCGRVFSQARTRAIGCSLYMAASACIIAVLIWLNLGCENV